MKLEYRERNHILGHHQRLECFNICRLLRIIFHLTGKAHKIFKFFNIPMVEVSVFKIELYFQFLDSRGYVIDNVERLLVVVVEELT
jgi:hypothetical protein